MNTIMPPTTMGGTKAGGSCGGDVDRIGDDYCDDDNNNEGCEWDGGDCCGSNVNTHYCYDCECLDPTNSPTTTTTNSPTTTTTTTITATTGKFKRK